MKKAAYFFFVLILIGIISYAYLKRDFPKSGDLLIHNGTIITMEPALPEVEAVFVSKGKIKALGSYQELEQFKTQATKILDLKGHTLLPGFIDPHTHPVVSVFLDGMLDLSGFTHKTPTEVWDHLGNSVANYTPGEWIVCKGLDPILVRGLKAPHISFLDSIAPNNPVLIISQSLHSYWANSLAFEKVGIDKHTPDPASSSYYEKDDKGNLTGFIAEQEAFKVFQDVVLSVKGKESLIQSTVKVLDKYAQKGNTSIASLGLTTTDANVLMLYQHLSSGTPTVLNQGLAFLGLLPQRKATVRHFAFIREDAAHLLPETADNGDDFFKILGIKLWYDGSPYTGSMYLRDAYQDSELTREGFHIEKGYRGEALILPSILETLIKKYQVAGWQIAIHAQGDLAIEEILESFDKVQKQVAPGDYRHRLEHCLLLTEQSIEKMAKLGIHPSFHINHLYYYGHALAKEIIGEQRAEKILPVKKAADQGLIYSIHADQPMFESDPLSLLHTAVNRQTVEGDTLGTHLRLSVEGGLKALTINAAWQMKMDQKIGSIKQGKYADFVILDSNPLIIEKEGLRNIKVVRTIINGNTVYQQEQ